MKNTLKSLIILIQCSIWIPLSIFLIGGLLVYNIFIKTPAKVTMDEPVKKEIIVTNTIIQKVVETVTNYVTETIKTPVKEVIKPKPIPIVNTNKPKSNDISLLSLKIILQDKELIKRYGSNEFFVVCDKKFLEKYPARSDIIDSRKSSRQLKLDNKYLEFCKNLGLSEKVSPKNLFGKIDEYATKKLYQRIFSTFNKKTPVNEDNLSIMKDKFAKTELVEIEGFIKTLKEIIEASKDLPTDWWLHSTYHK